MKSLFADGWQEGEPDKSGYYLAVWRLRGAPVVSELWFNPDAVKRWWFNRAYTGELRRENPLDGAVPGEIVAWMPLPLPPVDE